MITREDLQQLQTERLDKLAQQQNGEAQFYCTYFQSHGGIKVYDAHPLVDERLTTLRHLAAIRTPEETLEFASRNPRYIDRLV